MEHRAVPAPEPATIPSGAAGSHDPSRATGAPAVEASDLTDPRSLQILATEHWSLLATRSMSWNESFSRTGLFLSVLSASVVALGLVGGATGFGGSFAVFALALLPVTLFVGVATFVRLDEVNVEDVVWVASMNRIRNAYLRAKPGLEPYFSSGWTDDEIGVARTFAMTSDPTTPNTLIHVFVTTPGMVAVIDGALAAAISGIAIAAVVGPAMVVTIPAGLAVGVATTAILTWTSVRRAQRVIGAWQPRFPTPGGSGALPGLGYYAGRADDGDAPEADARPST
ncbi:MAG TPA: hypothetical protein VFK35_06350 [Candidatus Limnocylindrales bacterium]|nr:hypothetical protein [Candidatus Limnocylindrales bacterium]